MVILKHPLWNLYCLLDKYINAQAVTDREFKTLLSGAVSSTHVALAQEFVMVTDVIHLFVSLTALSVATASDFFAELLVTVEYLVQVCL